MEYETKLVFLVNRKLSSNRLPDFRILDERVIIFSLDLQSIDEPICKQSDGRIEIQKILVKWGNSRTHNKFA